MIDLIAENVGSMGVRRSADGNAELRFGESGLVPRPAETGGL